MDFETSKKLNEAILSDAEMRNLITAKQRLLNAIKITYIVDKKQTNITAVYAENDKKLLAKIDELLDLRRSQIERMYF
jgi:hypothetical protein